MKASRGVLLVALALVAIAALRDVARLGNAAPWRQLYDFADFYCAGAALDRGENPYRYEPLHRCEHAVNTSAVYRADPRRVAPAPQPPYDFPPFMLLAHVSFTAARGFYAVAIVLAVVAAVAGLALVGVPLEIAALALVLPAGYVLLNAGQIVPFALVALVFSGVALARQRPQLAGILAALVLIEPHFGLPVYVAMFVCVPRSRLALSVTLLLLAGISLRLVGPSGAGEYLFRVLPAHAAAEAGYAYQYSLTYLLRTFGTPRAAALIAGEVSYGAMLVIGVWLARRASARLGRPELVAYLPAACSVVAGPFVHMVDLPFAIPATLVLATVLTGTPKVLASVAAALFAVPWIPVWIVKKLFLASLFVVAALLLRLRIGLTAWSLTFVGIALSIYLLELAPPAPLVATTAGFFAAGDLAQEAWARYIEQLGTPSLTWLAVKVPTWLAMAGMLAAALRSSA